MESVNVAIISLGVMGRRMLTNMAADGRFAFTGVWDPDEQARARVAAEFPDIPIAGGPDAIISAPETDVVYISSPPAWHREYALAAADAGKRVFCEKPLGIDIAQSRDLVTQMEARKARAIVNFTQAPSHAAELTLSRLKAGELGEIAGADIVIHFSQWPRDWQIEADWLRFREQGGYVREVFSHFLFLTERLLGKAELVWSKPRYQADPALCESHIQAQLDCGGIPVSAFGSVGGDGPDRVELTLWGRKKSHRLHDWFWLQSSDGAEWVSEFAGIEDLRVANFNRILDNVVAFAEGKACVMASMREALSVQELVEEMLNA